MLQYAGALPLSVSGQTLHTKIAFPIQPVSSVIACEQGLLKRTQTRIFRPEARKVFSQQCGSNPKSIPMYRFIKTDKTGQIYL